MMQNWKPEITEPYFFPENKKVVLYNHFIPNSYNSQQCVSEDG